MEVSFVFCWPFENGSFFLLLLLLLTHNFVSVESLNIFVSVFRLEHWALFVLFCFVLGFLKLGLLGIFRTIALD